MPGPDRGPLIDTKVRRIRRVTVDLDDVVVIKHARRSRRRVKLHQFDGNWVETTSRNLVVPKWIPNVTAARSHHSRHRVCNAFCNLAGRRRVEDLPVLK